MTVQDTRRGIWLTCSTELPNLLPPRCGTSWALPQHSNGISLMMKALSTFYFPILQRLSYFIGRGISVAHHWKAIEPSATIRIKWRDVNIPQGMFEHSFESYPFLFILLYCYSSWSACPVNPSHLLIQSHHLIMIQHQKTVCLYEKCHQWSHIAGCHLMDKHQVTMLIQCCNYEETCCLVTWLSAKCQQQQHVSFSQLFSGSLSASQKHVV